MDRINFNDNANGEMRSAIENRVRRWEQQRWVVDSEIVSTGAEKCYLRMMKGRVAGGEGAANFSRAASRIRRFDDFERVFAQAAEKRVAKALAFEEQGRVVSAPGAVNGEAPHILLCDWLRDRVDGKPMGSARIYYETSGRRMVTPY